jgi:hypothetical protein
MFKPLECVICGKKLTYGNIVSGYHMRVDGVLRSVHKECQESVKR